ncbi:MAG TPA: dihydrodipicolinate synthase family protein [Streptosporangiaceae bacterium]
MTAGAGFLPAGPMVALATPVHADGTLDEGGLERLVARVVDGGIQGISPAGSTGEGALLTRAQRHAVCRRVRELAPPQMPVIAGLPLVTLREGPAELAGLADAGATAALVAVPFYYPLSDDGVLRVYETLAEHTPIPLVLYNIPVFTKIMIAPEVVGRLAAHPAIAGIKDSSRNMEYHQQIIYATAGASFSVLTGSDIMLAASLTLGATGTIAGSGNLVPDLVAGVCDAIASGQVAEALTRQQRLTRIVTAARAGYPPAGWKAALQIAGVCASHPVPPGTALSAEEYAKLAALLTDEGLAAVPEQATTR